MASPIFIGNSNIAQIDRLRDSDGTYDNSATVSATLVDSAGATVTGPTALSYVSGSDGKYQTTLSPGLSLTEGYKYTLQVTITSGGLTGYKELRLIATVRES